MNEELQRKIEEAKANGYSDEEIQQYLSTGPQQVQPQQPIDRSEEYAGLAQGAAGKAGQYALEYGVPGAAAYYGVKKIFGKPSAPPAAPTAPVRPEPLLNEKWDRALGVRQQGQPSMLQRGMEYADKVRQIAMDKVMQNASTIGKTGLGAAAAVIPGNIGQSYNFPTTGQYRGMEINPMTNRPWTPEELRRYQ